jgi:hypothetical protein
MAYDRLYIVDTFNYEYVLFAKNTFGEYPCDIRYKNRVDNFIESRTGFEDLIFVREMDDILYNKYIRNEEYEEYNRI